MDLGKHVCDVAPGYLEWRSNQVKDMVFPPVDDIVQPASPLLEIVPTEAEILRFEFEADRKVTNQKI